MGQEITYCYKCQTRLLGSDFDKGLAFRVGAQVSCSDCVRGLFSSLPPAEIDAEIARLKGIHVGKRGGTSSRFPAVRPATPDTSARMRAVPAAPPALAAPRSRLPWILGGSVAFLGIGIVILMSTSPGRPPSGGVEIPPPAPRRAELPSPVPASELPPGAFVEVDRLIAARVERDDYSAGARDLDQARLRHPAPTWIAGIDERRIRLEARAREALPRFLEPALAANHEGRADEVDRLRSFISAFPALAAEFDRRIAVTPVPLPPTPPPSPAPAPDPKPVPPKAPSDAAAYSTAWAQAMASRDPAAIATALEEIQKGFQGEEARAEAARDLALVRLAIPVRTEGLAALSKLAKDQRVKLDVRDDTVTLGSVEGALQSVDSVRVRLATDSGPLDLPVTELTEETIGRLYAGRAGHAPSDLQAAAVWCAIRGSAEGAQALDPSLPAKYRDFARKPPPPDPDGEERRAFWAAFSEFGMTRTRAAGLERLAKLPSPRFKAFIESLMDGAREAFFSGTDFATSGTFAASERDKVGTVWLSTTDLKTGDASLEATYYALPDQSYRAWVLAGGCCQEVLSFSLQASGLRGIDPKTKQEVPYEPGDPAGQPVKLPYLPLKKLHSQHLGPKEPDRWEWIPLPLPRSEVPGLKKIRLLTDQKGFAVAQLVVSATRKGPPTPAEVKDLLRDRSTTPRFTVSPGVVRGTPTRSAYCGGGGGGDFEDQAPAGGVLVGLRYSAQGFRGNLKYLQPLYRLGDKTSSGGGHGLGDASMPELVAKPGYAVGQMVLAASDRLDGFKIVFMRHAGGRLLAGDSYDSPWVGLPAKGEPKTLGDGSPVSGIFGHQGAEIDGFGLILLK